ncbi:MAG: hypothetical protein JJT96_18970 [Opitutales bacterium]|nr:hypothetical protein [Opitutales bacterium]
MKRFRLSFAIFASLGLLLGLVTGCQTIAQEDPDSQEIPWGQPASWEGTVPGMPGAGR